MPNPNPAKRVGLLVGWTMTVLNLNALVIYAAIRKDNLLLAIILALLIPVLMGFSTATIAEEIYEHSAAVTREREATKESSGL